MEWELELWGHSVCVYSHMCASVQICGFNQACGFPGENSGARESCLRAGHRLFSPSYPHLSTSHLAE